MGSNVVPGARWDPAKWFVAIALVAAGVLGNQYFSQGSEVIPLLYRVLALVALSVAVIFIVLQTVKGKALWQLCVDARIELRKVVWPTRQETMQTSLVVVLVVVVMAFILWGLDSLLGWLISLLIRGN